MALDILSPLSGRVVEFADVPDPVFAGGFLGPGVAIDPVRGEQTAVAPVAGTIASMFPHAFGIATPEGREVLVHLGIETVKLEGAGFTLHRAKGDTVAAGDPVVSWDPSEIEGGGRSPISPVVALQAEPGDVALVASIGADVAAGDLLFQVG
ncbi:MAG: PTS glucose transporter subunit IIA [Actinobacteria bacterium]|nr:PTS glucose transporter subunit IIA [Actinomycetota bacterium]MCB9412111.1 PTS glucose transporter subunit IIA [Actinomycetota bacterium]